MVKDKGGAVLGYTTDITEEQVTKLINGLRQKGR